MQAGRGCTVGRSRQSRGRRLRDEGTRLVGRFGIVLEQEVMNPHLARGMYRRAGFETVDATERWRPTVRRSSAGPGEQTSLPSAAGDGVRAGAESGL